MTKQLKDKILNQQIVTLAIIGLFLFTLSGCQQINNVANSNGNSNASADQANSSANSNTVADKTLKNNLIGTWISTSADNKFKFVFTENELTQYSGDKIDGKGKYKFVDGQTIEFTDEKTGETSRQKATVEGDELTVIFDGTSTKFKRESSTAEANNSTTKESEKIKEMKKNIIGTWSVSYWEKKQVVEGGKKTYPYSWIKQGADPYIFGEDEFQYLYPETHGDVGLKMVRARGPYRIVDEETVKWTQYVVDMGTTLKISFENKNTMIWEEEKRGIKHKFDRISNKSEFRYDEIYDVTTWFWGKLTGFWISDNKTLIPDHTNMFSMKINYNDGTSKNLDGKIKFPENYDETRLRQDIFFEVNDTQEKITTDGEVLTITDKNGAIEKYTRKKTVD